MEACPCSSSPARPSHQRVQEEQLPLSSSDQKSKQALIKPSKRKRKKKISLARREVIQTHGADTAIPVWQHQPTSFPADEVLVVPSRHVSFSDAVKRPRARKAPILSQQDLTDISKKDPNRRDVSARVVNNRRRIP